MPRPCAVESHARHYNNKPSQKSLRCHGLAPWSLTLAATKTTPRKNLSDATALRRGVSRSPLQKQPTAKLFQMPRPCPVESHARRYKKPPLIFLRCHGLPP